MDALGFPDRSQCICGREASSSQPSTTAVHTLQELQSAILCGTTGCLQQRRPSQLPHFGSEHNVTWRKAMRSAIKVLHHFAQLCQAQFSCKCSLLRSYTAGTVTRLLAVGMQQRLHFNYSYFCSFCVCVGLYCFPEIPPPASIPRAMSHPWDPNLTSFLHCIQEYNLLRAAIAATRGRKRSARKSLGVNACRIALQCGKQYANQCV